jgi:pilus assembly protein CpaB
VPRFRRPRSPVHLLRQVVAGLLAVLALVLALRPAPAAPVIAPAAEVDVVVAARDLPAGTTLAADDVVLTTFPEAAAPDGAATDAGRLTGEVLAGPVRRGEPVTDVRVVGPGLWAQVPAGQVAAPVRLADLAVATLLHPGDRVDVLATAADAAAAEVVARAALVVSTPTGADPDAPDPAVVAGEAGLLFLAVSAETAARLAGAATNSTLTVTLGRP